MNTKTKVKQTKPAEAKKGSGKKWLLLGLSVAATGALSYFGFQYWKKHKQGEDEGNNNMPDTNEETQSTYVPPKHKLPQHLKMDSH